MFVEEQIQEHLEYNYYLGLDLFKFLAALRHDNIFMKFHIEEVKIAIVHVAPEGTRGANREFQWRQI